MTKCAYCEQEITNNKRKYCDSKCKSRMARKMQLERLKEDPNESLWISESKLKQIKEEIENFQ